MNKNFNELTAYFAVSNQIPKVGVEFYCSIVGTEPNNYLSLIDIVIVPTEVSYIDYNICKIKTNVPNLTFVVLFHTLRIGNTFLGKIKTLPYAGEKFNCELLNFYFNTLNDFTVSWKECNNGEVCTVRKCAKDVYCIFTKHNVYLLMKNNT